MRFVAPLNFGLPDEDEMQTFTALGRSSFFLHPQWFSLIAECANNVEARTPCVALDNPANIALVCLRTADGRFVQSCTNLYTCVFRLAAPDARYESVRQFASDFARSLHAGAFVRLQGIEHSATCFKGLLDGFRGAGMVARPYFSWGTWYERTAGVNFEQYFKSRPSQLRNTWNRKRNSMAKKGVASYRFYSPGDDPCSFKTEYEDVHRRSWKAVEPYPQFVPSLIQLAAELNALRFGILRIDGVLAAAQFWIIWAGRATIFKLVYAEDMSMHSPGTLLTMEMFRRVLEQDKPEEIDFGRGDDPYKKLWLGMRREHWGIDAVRPDTVRGCGHAAWLGLGICKDWLTRRAGGDLSAASTISSRDLQSASLR